ncbi:hypothetical protein ACOMHN_013026 [Nucella lapillus]
MNQSGSERNVRVYASLGSPLAVCETILAECCWETVLTTPSTDHERVHYNKEQPRQRDDLKDLADKALEVAMHGSLNRPLHAAFTLPGFLFTPLTPESGARQGRTIARGGRGWGSSPGGQAYARPVTPDWKQTYRVGGVRHDGRE